MGLMDMTSRAYNELDDIPASVQPMLYDALEEWGYDGFIMADDTGTDYLPNSHSIAYVWR